MRRALLALVVSGCALLAVSTAPATAQSTTPPIQHLVVILEENSTFDHTFGTLHGVDGVHVGDRVELAGGETRRLRGFSSLGPLAFTVPKGEEVLSNGPTAASTAFNHGRMDGFVRAQRAPIRTRVCRSRLSIVRRPRRGAGSRGGAWCSTAISPRTWLGRCQTR